MFCLCMTTCCVEFSLKLTFNGVLIQIVTVNRVYLRYIFLYVFINKFDGDCLSVKHENVENRKNRILKIKMYSYVSHV